jgi:hypothetical protein
MIRRLVLGLGALALAMPAMPAVAADGTLIVSGGCGGATLRVAIPFDRPIAPLDDGGCCASAACHVGCEPQKRGRHRG